MNNQTYLDEFIKDCSETRPENTGERFVSWEPIIAILVYQGIKLLLPELKEWIKLGASVITLKRQEVKKRLIVYAEEKELNFPEAEKAASVIADKINEKNVGKLIRELEIAEG